MRIDSSGNVGIGNSNPAAFNSLSATDKLVIGDSTVSNLTLFGTQYGSLAFADSDASGSTAQYAGLIQYYHTDNTMQFYTASAERMRLDSSGNLLVGTTTSPSSPVAVNTYIKTGGGVTESGSVTVGTTTTTLTRPSGIGGSATVTYFNNSGGAQQTDFVIWTGSATSVAGTVGTSGLTATYSASSGALRMSFASGSATVSYSAFTV